jgi:hypothetical protein
MGYKKQASANWLIVCHSNSVACCSYLTTTAINFIKAASYLWLDNMMIGEII